MWGRGKAGQSLHETGRAVRVVCPFAVWCRITVGLFWQCVSGRSWRSPVTVFIHVTTEFSLPCRRSIS